MTTLTHALCAAAANRGVDIRLTNHAVDRYIERVRPALDRDAAAVDLARVITIGTIEHRPPDWLAGREGQRAAMYLVCGDVVLPLDPDQRDRDRLVALTCLTPDADSRMHRLARSARRRRCGRRR